LPDAASVAIQALLRRRLISPPLYRRLPAAASLIADTPIFSPPPKMLPPMPTSLLLFIRPSFSPLCRRCAHATRQVVDVTPRCLLFEFAIAAAATLIACRLSLIDADANH
jgi:hypothetical protein